LEEASVSVNENIDPGTDNKIFCRMKKK